MLLCGCKEFGANIPPKTPLAFSEILRLAFVGSLRMTRKNKRVSANIMLEVPLKKVWCVHSAENATCVFGDSSGFFIETLRMTQEGS